MRDPADAALGRGGEQRLGRAPVLGVPCCQKTASPVVPSPVPVP
jgi:hypothetical protein